jgi:hypothetical protein
MEIKPHYFVSIPAFAVLDLDLTSTEVIVYSTIYGYSHGDKDQWCCVSQSVLATWARTTERSVRRILDRLIEKGLIIKEVRNGEKGTYCAYKVFEEPITGEDIGSTGGEDTESTLPGHSVRPPEDTASAPTSNNIYNNINNNIKENIKRKSEEDLKQDFEELWKLYPRKAGKKDAFKYYKAAIKNGTTNEQIRQGIENYNAWLKAKNETEFIKHGSTFFSKEAWNDDYDLTHVNRGDPFDVRNQYWDENDPTVH